MEAVIFLLAAAWMLRLLLIEAGTFGLRGGVLSTVLPIALLAGLVAFQLAPLPPAFERIISPSTFELYQKSLPGWPERPIYNTPLPVRAHSADEVVLLPSRSEVALGARIPFATNGEQEASPPNLGQSLGKKMIAIWRPLSVATSLTRPALLKLISYLCLFLLVASYPFSESVRRGFGRRLLQGALLAGVVVATLALVERAFPNGKALWIFVPYDWGKGDPWGLRATGPFANPDHLANYLDLVLPIALAGFFLPAALTTRRPRATRFSCAAAVILIVGALLLSSSRGGWLGALVGFAVLAGLWPRTAQHGRLPRAAGIAAGASLGLFVLLVLLFVGPGGRTQADARLKETVMQDSLANRLKPAVASLGMVRDFPFFGVGLGCWPDVFPRYRKPPWSPIFWNATHNDYVQMATETGLLGFGLLVWFFAAALGHVWRGIRTLRPEVAALVTACVAGIGAAAVHEFVDFPLQIPANALLSTVLLGLAVRLTGYERLQPGGTGGRKTKLICAFGLISALALTVAAVTQKKVPYPYDLKQSATLAQAYSLVNAHPANASVHLMLISVMGEGAPLKRRMEDVRAAVWLEPINPLARDLYAQTLLRANARDQALNEITRAVSYSPALDSHFYLEPRMIPWLSSAEREAVEQGFQAAVANRYDGAVQNFASYYDVLGNFPAEAAVYEKAAASAPDRAQRAEYFAEAGTVYAKAREPKKAEAALRSAAASMPADSTAYVELVLQVFAPQKKVAAAKAAVAQGIEQGADPFKLYLALASAAQTSGDSSEAREALHKAVALRPSSFEAVMRMGLLELANSRFDQAAIWLHRATRLNPGSADAFYNLALADEGAYEYFAADKAYQRALGLAPTDAGLRAHYAAFRQKLAQSERETLKP